MLKKKNINSGKVVKSTTLKKQTEQVVPLLSTQNFQAIKRKQPINNKLELKKKRPQNKQQDEQQQDEQQQDEQQQDEQQQDEQQNNQEMEYVNTSLALDAIETSTDITFEKLGVCTEILEAIKKLSWKKPTKIQIETIPYVLQDKDVIGIAETGSGKTGAFAIPAIQKLLDNPQHSLFALILAPTRELAIQITEQFESIGSLVGLRCISIIGGVNPMDQSLMLAKNPHIVVGTPGRVLFHLENTKGFTLRTIKFLVLDEADRLLHMNFEEEIDKIIKIAPKDRISLLFSATMTSKVVKLQRACLKDPVRVQINSKFATVSTLVQNYILVPQKYKDCYLVHILNEYSGNTVIIFVDSRRLADRVWFLIKELGILAVEIHGHMLQQQRMDTLALFKSSDANVLIATDIASRGLDISNVDLVINYSVPENPKDYIHRVGRTARAGASGRAITFVTQYDIESYQQIEKLINIKLDLFAVEEDLVLINLPAVQEAQRKAASHSRLIDAKEKKKATKKKALIREKFQGKK
eukprot:TRINITY_DN1428_c0_g1_i1.p1 TRINITY_DN1428_c0_g1~~TRINITY_DN1428_c0_g1_i1.p1  ORF type:complete len:552 (-),score=273.19 TRINITY_DN1428_c0_g1_i1:206-1777(-)